MILGVDQVVPPDSTRLTFRLLRPGDAEIWKSFVTSEEAMRYFNLPRAESESAVWIERQLGRYATGKGGMAAVLDKSGGAFLGQCGPMIQEVDGKEMLEVGYSFLPSNWKKGFASEAAGVFYRYGFSLGIADFIISIIHVDNKPSQAVAKRNGLSVWEQTTWKENPVDVWRIFR